MQTEAFVLTKFGSSQEAFQLKEVSLPALQANEVLIKSEAFGLNYADVMARQGLYREAPPVPCVLGYELVGVVEQIGPDVNQEWLGKRVLAFTRFGAYAKHAITKLDALVEIPADIAAADALPFATQGVTAYYMTDMLAPIQKHDNVLVHAAAGGVGSFLIQLAKRKGANVIASASNPEKLAYCKELGAQHVVNYKAANITVEVQKILGEQKLQVAYNPIGGKTSKTDFKLLGPGGRLFLFGGSDLAQRKGLIGKLKFLSEMGFYLPIAFMMQSKSLLGVNMLKIADEQPHIIQQAMTEMLALYTNKQIQLPAIQNFKSSQFFEAHDALGAGSTKGKLAIYWD
ncbi:MAG: hypothetical protein RLZZ65_1296 [Bacteroidota bacterium]|jgi:NADPH2:quinone reductase